MALGDSRRESGQQMERARRQIGNDNEQARRQIGANMESQRRAIDAQMLASRRGVSVVEDMQRLESPARTQRSLPAVAPVGGIPAARGRAYYSDKPKLGGGGIASPLTLMSITYSDVPDYVETIDGSGLFRVKKISVITLQDADGQEVVVNVPAD